MWTNAELLAIKKAVRDQLWRQGDLSFKLNEDGLHPAQPRIYKASKECKKVTFVTEAARRSGKTYTHAIIAVELALKNPGRRINWCQHTKTEILASAVPLFKQICKDAPPDCQGEFKMHRNVFEFPNGAYIYFFGANSEDDVDRARGGDNPIANFVDEAGHAEYLEYTYTYILKPAIRQTERVEHFGMNFIFSTTPKTPLHFFVKLADRSKARGSYCKETIYDSPNAERFIARDADDDGLTVEQFVATTHFKREYLCERLVDDTLFAFPEFHANRNNIVQKWIRPNGFVEYLTMYVAIDPGGAGENADRTAMVFGYVDWLKQKIVIEGEVLMKGPNTADMAKAVKAKEDELWPGSLTKVCRIIDDTGGPTRFVLDFWEIHKLRAIQAEKQDRPAGIAMVRALLQNGTIIISPDCVLLQKQLAETLNAKNGKGFQRNADGHGDLCDALLYMVRTCSRSLVVNPYPKSFDVVNGRQLPAFHPIMARAQTEGANANTNLVNALLGGNKQLIALNQRPPKKLTLLEQAIQASAKATLLTKK